MKVDDDSYVRMELLSEFLLEKEKKFRGKEFFFGYLEPISGALSET
jgi:hypothetical protein